MPPLTALEPLATQDPRTIGAFRLRARLGSGGMGRVYLGSSPAGRAVAVKVVHPELARDEMFRKRFRREVAAARRVSGAYTAPVIDAGPDDEIPWLATAYVAGPSVADAVAAAGPLPPDSVLRLGGGLAEALADIHATDLVHRDLKPSNVLLAADGPRVIDFGISRALEMTVMTTTGVVIGTPAFMSPEQAAGQEAGQATDVFSLGAVLAYAATGRVPFGEGSPVTVLYRVVHAEPDLNGLDGPLRDLIACCLAKDPAARPTTREVATMTYALAEDSGGPEQAHSFWPAMLDALIRSYADRAAEIPAWLVNTMTVPQAATAEDPTGLAHADAGQPAVSDRPADTGDQAGGDAADAADSSGSTADESASLIVAGMLPADAPLPVAANDVPGSGVSSSGAVPGDLGMPPGHGPGASHSGADDGTYRPARFRPLKLSRGVLAAALAVLLAACVAAAVTLLPPGGPKAGANPPLGAATSHASSAAAPSGTTLPSMTAPRHSTSAPAAAKPSLSEDTAPPGTPSPGANPASSANPTSTPGVSQGTRSTPPPSPTRTASSPPHRSYPVPGLLGVPDWNGYCEAQGLGAAHLTRQDAYGWYCSDSSASLDGNSVCAWSFNLSTSQVTNTITNFNDPASWECFTATEQLSPPNWSGYCTARGLGPATLQPGNAYGWHCSKDGSAIDGNSACEWTNGASTLVVSRFQNFYDSSSWQCWV